MSELKIMGAPLPNIPWEERPAGCKNVMWRYSANPIIPRDLLPDSNSIFNSAVVPFGDGYAGVFRCDDTRRRMMIHAGFSKDGIHWDINPEVIKFADSPSPEVGEFIYGYDPRVAFIDGKYYFDVLEREPNKTPMRLTAVGGCESTNNHLLIPIWLFGFLY